MATTPTVPATLLNAVNVLLQAVGQAEVMSLETTDTNEESRAALTALSDVATEVQQEEWHFNTETDYPIDPDTSGFINLPTNVAAVITGQRSYSGDYTQRGSRLYDRKNHTFVIGVTVYVDIRFIFEFADVPPPIRWYITAYAGKRFGTNRVPDSTTYKFTEEVMADALAKAEAFDQDARGNVLTGTSTHFYNMRRGSFP